MNITILNKSHGYIQSDTVFYIGRGSVLGNPYSHRKFEHTIKCRSRDEAIALYEQYLIREYPSNIAIRAELHRLKDAAEKGPISLLCYCTPKRCHGEIIKKILLSS